MVRNHRHFGKWVLRKPHPPLTRSPFPKGEGFLKSSLNRRIYPIAHPSQITPYLVVWYTQNFNTLLSQKLRTNQILFCFPWLIMLRAIQFDCQFRFRAIKIHNIISAGNLPAELNRIFTQIPIPQLLFFLGHIPAKLLCKVCKILIMLHSVYPLLLYTHIVLDGVFITSSVTAYAVPPSPLGKGY